MNFDLQPTLRGELVELRPLRRDDFESLFAAAQDPLIWEQHPEQTRYTRSVFQTFFDGAIDSGGAFAVVDRKTGRVIGTSRYANLTPNEVEIGWTFLERAYWGGAYNGDMKSLMIEHALKSVDRVVFKIGEHNLRSQKAVEKIGARFWRYAEDPAQDGSKNLIFVITR